MWSCPNCLEILRDGPSAEECPKCRASFGPDSSFRPVSDSASDPSGPIVWSCPNCFETLTSGLSAKDCAACGASFGPDSNFRPTNISTANAEAAKLQPSVGLVLIKFLVCLLLFFASATLLIGTKPWVNFNPVVFFPGVVCLFAFGIATQAKEGAMLILLGFLGASAFAFVFVLGSVFSLMTYSK